MKTIYILASIFLALSFNSTNQKHTNDLEKMNLNGKVKFLKEISYKAIVKSGGIGIIKGKQMRKELDMDYSVSFNKSGNITEKTTYYYNGNIEEKITKKYNEIGKIIEEIHNSDNNIYKIFYEYNNQKYLTKITSGSQSFRYKNDASGKIIEEREFLSDEDTGNYKTYQYDEKGNKIVEKNFSDDSITYKWLYKYDENNNLIEYNNGLKNSGSSFIYKWIYKYDNNNNVIEISEYSPDFLDNNKTFKYNFDKFGNWIKKICFENGLPKYILEREIIYFN